MEKQERKAAITQYKERKSVRSVYAVICTSTGEAWVGTSRNLAAQQNSLWFSLRMGSCPFKTLQTVWTEHGETNFRFEELDRLADDFSELLYAGELKKASEVVESTAKRHAFMNEQRDVYDRAAAELASGRLLVFFRIKLA